MKILVVTQKSPFPALDGGSVAFLNGLECLSEICDEVHLLSFNPIKNNKPEWPLWFREKYHAESIDIDTSHSLFKFIKSIFSPFAYILYRFFNKKIAFKINEVVNQNNIDYIVFESIYTGVYAQFIQNRDVIKILKVHNVEHRIWDDLSTKSSFLKKMAIQLATFKLKKNEIEQSKWMDKTIAFTKVDADFFKPFAQSVEIIGMHSPLCELTISELKPIDNQSFFHLAAMDWMPNIEALDWLINKVWPIVNKTCIEAQLHLAGKNMPDRFKKLSHQNIVNQEAKVASDFIQNNGIMLVPLFSGSGIRVKIIEGMSLGRCIICTSKALLGIPATNNKNVLVADTAVDFANQMIDCFENKKKVDEIGSNAAIFARNQFSKKEIAKQWEEVFKKMKVEP